MVAPASRLSLLVDMASILAHEVDLDAVVEVAAERLRAALGAERATIWLMDAERGELVSRIATLPELPILRQALERGIAGHVARTGESVRVDDALADARFDPSVDKATGYRTRSMIVVPMRERSGSAVRGVVQVIDSAVGRFDEEDERYLVALAQQLARVFGMTSLKTHREEAPGLVLRGPFNHIVGTSPAMARVYEKIALVAGTDASVLLRGETGTGKGLVARALHVNSKRSSGPFVTLDCTTLPVSIAESLLFGHERGAFTGAERRATGHVERAQGGTLFIDEIGELSLEVQAKLLRLIQERTFERVGGHETHAADLRLLCASHRDLDEEVRRGRFREDLYYRIRVVELELPPLRARGGAEVRALAEHFAAHYAARYGRPSPSLSAAALRVLEGHAWPGNVRELEHWIESAVVLSPTGELGEEHFPVRASARPGGEDGEPDDAILLPLNLSADEVMRRYGEAVLRAHGNNKTEVARRLGIGRNTLLRMMKAPPKK